MAITIDHISLSFPDATTLFAGLTATIPSGLVGLVGDNGTGKSTLARLVAGLLPPDGGQIAGAGRVSYVPQDVPASTAPVSRILGIEAPLAALHRILRGSTEQADYDAVGTDWDVAERGVAACAQVGVALTEDDLDRPMNSFSGGQAMRIVLAATALRDADWLVLDEPTNNLDAGARAELADQLTARFGAGRATGGGGALVISHDRALLRRVDAIAELARTGNGTPSLRIYGGNWDFYRETRFAEDEAVAQHAVDARKVHRARRDERIAQATRAARANKKGAKDAAAGRWAPIVAGAKKRAAQVSQAKSAGRAQDAEAVAAAAADSAAAAARREQEVHIDLPDAAVHARSSVLDLVPDPASPRGETGRGELRIAGPARMRLLGANGEGKSTLVSGLVARSDPAAAGRAHALFGDLDVKVHVPVGYLGQHPVLPAAVSAAAYVAGAPGADPHAARELLAALGLRGALAELPCGALSGGQCQRAALARVLASDPPPGLLVLDEPTNDVDVTTADVLAAALADFGGALLVITHDDDFADALELDSELDTAELRVP